MKQGCVLAPTLFGAFFAEAFEDTAEGNYLRTKPDGMLFNISTLKQIPNEISAWSPLCQLTMQPSPPTQPKTLSSSWTISARPAKTLHWPPAWKIKTQVMAPNASTYLPALQSWSWTGGCPWLHISWLDDLWHSFSEIRGEQLLPFQAWPR